MNERLLQYIWQFKHYNSNGLTTAEGETVSVIHPGTYNTNQGPDFLEAKIKVGETVWAGNVELHVHSSGWDAHGHSADRNYNNVVLHVVWQNDAGLKHPFPVVELEGRVSRLLIEKYEAMMSASAFIPCGKSISTVPAITWLAWKERLLVERLQQKSEYVLKMLEESGGHWEEIFWWVIAKNFGLKVNSAAFESVARSLPLNIIARHKNQLQQLEALLFGQASLLEGSFSETYPAMLQKEYLFLQKKYRLVPVRQPLHFLRMRPSNFPTIRLAQLAMLLQKSVHLFSKIKGAASAADVKKLLDVTANDYWHYHYQFDEETVYKKKKLGSQMLNNIIINTVVPVLFAFGRHHSDNSFKDMVLEWLTQLPPEKNSITSGFVSIGIENKSAFDSQALLQLKNNYCSNKRCLECAVGNALIRSK